MTMVHLDPGKQKPRLAFDRELVFPNLAPGHSLINDYGGVLSTSLCAPQNESILYSKEATESEKSQMHRWLEPNGSHATDPDDMANKTSMTHEAMSNGLDGWPEALTSPYFEESKVQFYGCQVQSSAQIQGPFIQSVREISIPQTHGQYAQYAAHAGNQERTVGENIETDDVILGVAHPIPRVPILCMTGSSFSSFSGLEPESVATSPFSTPDNSRESWLTGNRAQTQEWAISGVESSELLRTSSEKTSLPIINCSTSVSGPSTPPPWSTAGVRAACNVQQQSNSRGDALWVEIPCKLSMNGLDDQVTEDFDHDATANNNLQSSPLQVNACQYYAQSTVTRCQSRLGHASFPLINERFSDDSQYRTAQPYHDSPCIHHLVQPTFTTNKGCFLRGQGASKQIACHSDGRDAFLVECKRRGLSYKDIKRIGGFKEAESTLRGRFRTLTKSKAQRVRKPQWQEKDISLLCQAVKACIEDDKQSRSDNGSSCRPPTTSQPPKVSWKRVAQYIWTHGGSYHFGNATCKKKWCEIHGVKLWN
ncbi:hypothetical protein BDV38DRAFT_268724 [Aspergillus pseudotamarii]|uniref:Myb-like domain-containing protein n=1 Tax=Aspergillus pseudotamarii TaxID=132259 RepID=A0A5N6T3W0_ASPPS|nr:uncharacterized protein BDV38DRAFT_268724 [Aspergillus pseudotamarii]KAE8140990.1 hypothetical protein BDV38DRAFT_268724 [Aspergillus pseudotamarii]